MGVGRCDWVWVGVGGCNWVWVVVGGCGWVGKMVKPVKYWFIVLTRTDSSEIRLFFSISVIFIVFKPLSLKNVFQKLLKYLFCFVFLKRFTQKLRCFL